MRASTIVSATAVVGVLLAGALLTGELRAQTDDIARPDAAN